MIKKKIITQKVKPLLSFIVEAIKAEKEIKPLIKNHFQVQPILKPNPPSLLTSIWRKDEFWHFLCCVHVKLWVWGIYSFPSAAQCHISVWSQKLQCICAGMTERETLLRWMSLKKETSRHFYHIHWLCSGENKLYWNHIWERNILYENDWC